MHTAKTPHLHAGFRACLTLSEAAFVLETEFIQLTAIRSPAYSCGVPTTLQGSNTFIGFGQAGLRPAL
jgi:hypothetical protein